MWRHQGSFNQINSKAKDFGNTPNAEIEFVDCAGDIFSKMVSNPHENTAKVFINDHLSADEIMAAVNDNKTVADLVSLAMKNYYGN